MSFMKNGDLVMPLKDQKGVISCYMFWCWGCDEYHGINVGPNGWKFNGDTQKPTLTPSLLVEPNKPEDRCHLFVTNGQIRYCGDCHHDLRGQTLDMAPFDENGDLSAGYRPKKGFRS